MAWLRIGSVVATAALLAIVAVGTVPGGVSPGHDDEEIQSPAQAFESDLKATAEAKGWTIAQTRAHFQSNDAVDRIARRVHQERPDIFIGSIMATDPKGAPSLYIKGPAPKWVRDLAADAAATVRIVDEQPYSRDQLHERAEKVLAALLDMGFEQATTAYDLAAGGMIEADVLRTPGVTDVRSKILEGIPQSLRSSVDLRVGDNRFDDGDHARGGTKIYRSGHPGHYCTSGYSVEHLTNGKKGVVSAGHCGYANPDPPPAVLSLNRMHTDDPHTMDYQDEHRGWWGDVEWYTTNATEQAKFRASPTEVREVVWREQVADIGQDDAFCLYGKTSDKKICGVAVHRVDKQCCCTPTGNYHHLVIMKDDVGEPGDSGGPWYIFNTAVGVHHGECHNEFPGKDGFTPIDYLDEALDIRVMKAE